MLHRLEIENFYSIRERQVIDLRADAHAPEEPGRLAPLWPGSTERAPKVVALFGANASGKSNVLKALAFVAWFIKDSFDWPSEQGMPFQRFYDLTSVEAPTRLAIYLAGFEHPDQAGDPEAVLCRYAYEFEVGGSGNPIILSEGLYYWPAHSKRKARLFERNAEGEVIASRAFNLGGFRQTLSKALQPGGSVIATLARMGHPFSKHLQAGASTITGNILVDRQDVADNIAVQYYAARPKLMEAFNREVGRIDLGIQGMHMQTGQNGPLALFTHEGFPIAVPMALESRGTREFIKLYPTILQALETGGIAVLDELDASIHPRLLPELLRWFADPARNPRDAQLWMSCHNASLLEDLIKEEIYFCEKDGSGRTSIYGLRDIQSIRRTDNYYRKYLGGVYGALPHIG